MCSRRFCLCLSFPRSGSLQSTPQDSFRSKPKAASLSLKTLSPVSGVISTLRRAWPGWSGPLPQPSFIASRHPGIILRLPACLCDTCNKFWGPLSPPSTAQMSLLFLSYLWNPGRKQAGVFHTLSSTVKKKYMCFTLCDLACVCMPSI